MQTIKRNLLAAYMKSAKAFGELSYCERLKVGAVAVKDDSILSFGYNGTPSGFPNVCELEDGTTNPLVVHAERNALKKLYRKAESSQGASMFQTHSPCLHCAIEMVDAGFKAVFFKDWYRSNEGVIHLLSRGVNVYQVLDCEDGLPGLRNLWLEHNAIQNEVVHLENAPPDFKIWLRNRPYL